MKLESQVISLTLAKRLKELGMKQEAQLYWREDGLGLVRAEDVIETVEFRDGCFLAAFTVAELGEMLKEGMTDSHNTGYGYWTCKYTYLSQEQWPVAESRGATEAEARGLMLAYLIENNLLTT